MKQSTALLIIISWFLLVVPGSLFSQENLEQQKSSQDKIVEKIMDLSNRNYAELAKYLEDRDLITENKLITIMLDNNMGERPQRRPCRNSRVVRWWNLKKES